MLGEKRFAGSREVVIVDRNQQRLAGLHRHQVANIASVIAVVRNEIAQSERLKISILRRKIRAANLHPKVRVHVAAIKQLSRRFAIRNDNEFNKIQRPLVLEGSEIIIQKSTFT